MRYTVYTCTGQTAEYEEMCVTLFVSGFLMVMTGEETIRPFMLQHLKELTEDAELYGWEPIWAFHAV